MESVAPAAKEFELTKRRLWLFRIAMYSIPIGFLCSAIYCFVYHVPNPRSVVPKSVILLIEAVTFAMYICQIELSIRGPKAKPNELRFVTAIVPFLALLLWVLVFALRNNPAIAFTGEAIQSSQAFGLSS